jgi:phage terminase small subunit
MPRKSSAALLALPYQRRTRPRLAPSDDAPAAVREVFQEIVRSAPADHFQTGDAPLIQAYAEAIVLARKAAVALDKDGPVVGGRANPWIVVQEKAHRAIAAMAMRLRLSPQHRQEAKIAARRAGDARPSVYDTLDDVDDV